MFAVMFEGYNDGILLGVRKTWDEAVALCQEAHARGPDAFDVVGRAGIIPGQHEIGGTYHHTAVVSLDDNGNPTKRTLITRGPDW